MMTPKALGGAYRAAMQEKHNSGAHGGSDTGRVCRLLRLMYPKHQTKVGINEKKFATRNHPKLSGMALLSTGQKYANPTAAKQLANP
jgi:hypothetical protein